MKEFHVEFTNVALTKWPQMLVWGQPISRAQADEIIRRTDSLLLHGYGGNDKAFDAEVLRLTGRPHLDDYAQKDWLRYNHDMNHWLRLWGIVDTEYVRNSWLSCAYIYGPHGWCHPDGTIHYRDNIGKWPDAIDVYKEWLTLSRAFPFLDLQAVLMSDEMDSEHSRPLLVIDVAAGKAWANDPASVEPFARFGRDVHAVAKLNPRNIEHAVAQIALGARHREHGLGLDVVRRWMKTCEYA